MSTLTKVKTFYKCTVAGDFIKKEAGGKTNGNYELSFNVPNLGPDKTDIHYMSIIKKELLQKKLKAKYPNAISFRTYEMVDRQLVDANDSPISQDTNRETPPHISSTKNITSMHKTELLEYISVNNLDIDTEVLCTTVDKMRKAIKRYEENKELFLQEQKDALAEIELQNTLADLNPIVSNNPNSEEIIGEELISDETEE